MGIALKLTKVDEGPEIGALVANDIPPGVVGLELPGARLALEGVTKLNRVAADVELVGVKFDD
jgi:hypothetical protein